MHAIMVTFRSAIPLADLAGVFTQFAQTMRDDPAVGLVTKTWIFDDSKVGGFTVFENRDCADRYLNGMFADAISSNSAFSEIRIEHFDVVEDLSRITNGVGGEAAVAHR